MVRTGLKPTALLAMTRGLMRAGGRRDVTGQIIHADLGREGGRLIVLQTRQALGIQAMSIANAGQQTLLSLFA